MPATLTGFYINLDRSTDRDAWMREQLDRLGMTWVRRAPAIDAATLAPRPASPLLPGEIACYASHLAVIRQAPPDAFTLVLEDDTELSPQAAEVLTHAVAGGLPGTDVLLLECQHHFSLSHVAALWGAAHKHFLPDANGGVTRRVRGIELMEAAQFYKWGLPAYVVTPAGRAKLLPLLERGFAEGPQRPIDRHIEAAFVSGELRGLIAMPFLATTGLRWHGRSTIGNGYRMPGDTLMVIRRLLFAGPIDDATAMAQGLSRLPGDPALDMLSVALRQVALMHRAEAQFAAQLIGADGTPRVSDPGLPPSPPGRGPG